MADRPVNRDLARSWHQLEEPGAEVELLRPLASARCLFFDVEALRRDVPELVPEPLDAAARQRLERWLLATAAVVSEPQTAPNDVNTAIPLAAGRRLGYRPPRYGRATVVPFAAEGGYDHAAAARAADSSLGLLDVKGVGVVPGRTPSREDHGNGLLRLSEAFEEIAYQRLVDRVLAHAGSPIRALPIYALVDPGFDVFDYLGQTEPAALIVRAGHRRPPEQREVATWGSPQHRAQLEVEMVLRQYGISSAFPLGEIDRDGEGFRMVFYNKRVTLYDDRVLELFWRECGGAPTTLRLVNIQTTASAVDEGGVPALVDFGQFRVYSGFDEPLVSFAADRPLRWGGVLRPDDPGFLQPRAELAVSAERFGPVEIDDTTRATLQLEGKSVNGVELFAHRLVHRHRHGQLPTRDLLGTIDAFLAEGLPWAKA